MGKQLGVTTNFDGRDRLMEAVASGLVSTQKPAQIIKIRTKMATIKGNGVEFVHKFVEVLGKANLKKNEVMNTFRGALLGSSRFRAPVRAKLLRTMVDSEQKVSKRLLLSLLTDYRKIPAQVFGSGGDVFRANTVGTLACYLMVNRIKGVTYRQKAALLLRALAEKGPGKTEEKDSEHTRGTTGTSLEALLPYLTQGEQDRVISRVGKISERKGEPMAAHISMLHGRM